MTLLTYVFFDDALIVEVAVSIVFRVKTTTSLLTALAPTSLGPCLSTNRRRIKHTLLSLSLLLG